ISIAGGKLTGYRKMAERIIDLVAKKYKRRFEKEFDTIQTEEIVLSGGPFQNFKAVTIYTNLIYKNIKSFGFTKTDAEYLVYNYGKQTDIILDKFNELSEENHIEKLLKAELWFTINHEMVCTPTDFFMRRTGRLFFDSKSVLDYKNLVLEEFSKTFSWKKETIEKHLKDLEGKIQLATKYN
ncbi:MAG: glycerol-3-phosphate dehydrogenase C-terminal domain-containing protein, partial [Flavobacteriaceae bacterium]